MRTVGTLLLPVRVTHPFARLLVDEKTEPVLLLLTEPAEIDAPQLGAASEGERGERSAGERDIAAARRARDARSLEAEGRPDVEALLLTLVLVGRNPLAAAGADVGELEEVLDRRGELGFAVFAPIGIDGTADGVEVAAGLALLRRAENEPGLGLTRRQEHTIDLITLPLVVDERLGAKLADGKEAGAIEVFLVAAAGPARNEGRKREAGEVISRQKPFAGEVAVGVEVGLLVRLAVFVQEQVALQLRLASEAIRIVPGPLGDRKIVFTLVFPLALRHRGPVEIAPPVTRPLESIGQLEKHLVEPLLRIPLGLGETFFDS